MLKSLQALRKVFPEAFLDHDPRRQIAIIIEDVG
jgi:hypothetical protein